MSIGQPVADSPDESSLSAAESVSRLRWHCRRGMRELDVVLQRYLEQRYPVAPQRERQAFARLLDQQDPQLLAYLMGREMPADPDQAHVVTRLTLTGV